MPATARLRDRLLLYLVLDPDHVRGDPLALAAAAIRAGVTAVQLRSKGKPDRLTLELARQLRLLTADRDVLLLVNDRVDLALASNADGVHLGVDDLPLEAARLLGGPDFVIGFSPETDEHAAQAKERGASYLGVGPVYGTATKSDAGEAVGVDAVARRAEMARLPTIGIGGITASTASAVVAAGACGVAVVSAIAHAVDPEEAARQIRIALGR